MNFCTFGDGPDCRTCALGLSVEPLRKRVRDFEGGLPHLFTRMNSIFIVMNRYLLKTYVSKGCCRERGGYPSSSKEGAIASFAKTNDLNCGLSRGVATLHDAQVLS